MQRHMLMHPSFQEAKRKATPFTWTRSLLWSLVNLLDSLVLSLYALVEADLYFPINGVFGF